MLCHISYGRLSVRNGNDIDLADCFIGIFNEFILVNYPRLYMFHNILSLSIIHVIRCKLCCDIVACLMSISSSSWIGFNEEVALTSKAEWLLRKNEMSIRSWLEVVSMFN